MEQTRYNLLDTRIKITTIIITIFFTFVGFRQYKEIKEREFKKEFYQKQIETIDETISILTSFEKSKNDKERSYARLWDIFYGKGRLYLDQEMFNVLSTAAKHVAVCEQKIYKSEKINCEQWSPYGYASLFAKTARKSLGKNWKYDFEEITTEDPWNTAKIEK